MEVQGAYRYEKPTFSCERFIHACGSISVPYAPAARDWNVSWKALRVRTPVGAHIRNWKEKEWTDVLKFLCAFDLVV